MANRFLETNYYKSPFVRKLKGAIKGLYSFIICDCTPSGIWVKDIQAASMYIGFDISNEDFEENFIKTGKAVYLGNDKYFFPDFIEHQYPKGLQDNNVAHKNIIFELKKHDLLDEKNNLTHKKNKGAIKGLYSPTGIGIGNNINNNNTLTNKEAEKKVFNNRPAITDFNGLPEIYISKAIEKIKLTKQTDIDIGTVKGIWEVFKVQKLTGDEYYANEGKVYSHFLDWIKFQNFNNAANKQTTGKYITKQNAGAHQLLERGNKKFNEAREGGS
jgi:hypothetical protein